LGRRYAIARCMRTDSLSKATPCRVARNGRRRFTRAFETLERFEPVSIRGSSGAPLGAPARGADHAQGEWNEHRGVARATASTIGTIKQDAHRAYELLRSLFGRTPSKQPIRPGGVVSKAALSRSSITALAHVANS
jgi:hypothetical protein